MLNLSDKSINHLIKKDQHKSLNKITDLYRYSHDSLVKILIAMFFLVLLLMFMPWTQNVRSKGQLIALNPEQRPQTIQSVIAGRIEKWYVSEGQYVNKGDTILKISEVKDEYFDPELLNNTQLQLDAKEYSKLSYEEKVKALDNQISALKSSLELKIQQAKNKVRQNELKVASDSIEYMASKVNFSVANEQYERFKTLFDDGLRSLTDLENRQVKMQEAQAKLISQENTYLTSKNELLNKLESLKSLQKSNLKKKLKKFETYKKIIQRFA